MKKILFKLAILTALVSGISSCKKGEDDPFLSLRSRKARLTGEWKLSRHDKIGYENDAVIYTAVTELDDGASREFKFEKDGSFEIVTVDEGITYAQKGNWVFGGKNKQTDMKNKECLFLDVTSFTSPDIVLSSSNFAKGNLRILPIKRLSNKEIVFEDVDEYGGNMKEVETIILSKK